MSKVDMYIIVVAIGLAIIQGSWIFYDAGKRGENKWLWGLFGLLHVPSCIIIYLLITRRITRQIICPTCLYSIQKDAVYCPYCGHELTENERVQGKIDKISVENKNK